MPATSSVSRPSPGAAATGPVAVEGGGLAAASGPLVCRVVASWRFDRPVEGVVVACRLAPPGATPRFEALPSPSRRTAEIDRHGCRIDRMRFAGPLARLTLVATVTAAAREPAGSPGRLAIGRPVAPDAAVADYLEGRGHPGPLDAAGALALARAIARDIRHVDDAGGPPAGVARMLSRGRGSCGDRARLLAAALAALGAPTRLAAGWLAGGDAFHAWVELLAAEGRWHGLDPSLGAWCDARHVATAMGASPEEIAPLTGRVLGRPADQRLELAVSAGAGVAPALRRVS